MSEHPLLQVAATGALFLVAAAIALLMTRRWGWILIGLGLAVTGLLLVGFDWGYSAHAQGEALPRWVFSAGLYSAMLGAIVVLWLAVLEPLFEAGDPQGDVDEDRPGDKQQRDAVRRVEDEG